MQVQADPVAHYWLLETVRQFAAGRVAASGEDTAVHASLLEWALDEAWSAEPAGWAPSRPGLVRPAVCRAGQHSCRVVLGAGRRRAGGGTGRSHAGYAALPGRRPGRAGPARPALAIELARTAAGREGLALALSAWSMCSIAGLSIQPATVAALDEAGE